jgi:hypothetical protein
MTNAQDVRGKPPSLVATTDVLASRHTDYEMELAREAQARFLPRKFPHLKTLSHAGICVPVGGDFSPFHPALQQDHKTFGIERLRIRTERALGRLHRRSHAESQTGP